MTSEPKGSLASRLGDKVRSRGARRTAIGVVIAVALYGLLGFFAAPPLIRHVAQQQLGKTLDRPTTIGKVALNPYTLRLEVDGVHVAERGGAGEFASIGRLVVRVSWMTLLRFAPIVTELRVDSPSVNVVRYDAQRFNFSDIAEKFAKPSAQPSSGPTLFSVSNIAVDNGHVTFDDRLLGAKHVVDQLSLGVPFIATLPSQTDIFVDPSFSARVDGSPISISGKTKPFAKSRESDVALTFSGLDVPRLLSYVPTKLPLEVQSGKLAGDLKLRFVMSAEKPTLTVTGTADLTDAQILDATKAPFFSAQALHVAAAGLQPLAGVYRFDEIRLDQPSLHLTREHSGALSIASAFASQSHPADGKAGQAQAASDASGAAAASAPAGSASTRASAASTVSTASAVSAASAASAPSAASAASGSGASAPAAASAAQPAPLDVSIKHFALNDGSIALEDRVLDRAVSLDLTKLTATVDDLSTVGADKAHYSIQTALKQGGSIAATGALGLAAKQADAQLTIDSLALPVAQPYLDGVTGARVADGTLGAKLALDADWSKATTQLRVGAGEVTLKSLKVMGPDTAKGAAPAVALTQGSVAIKSVDMAAQSADIERVEAIGLTVSGSREKDGRISFAELAQPPRATQKEQRQQAQQAQRRERAETEKVSEHGAEHHPHANSNAHRADEPTKATETKSAQSGWHYRIGELLLKDGAADITDEAAPSPAKLHVAPIQLDVRNITEDLSRPLAIKLEASLNGKGTLDVGGNIVPSPLDASLTVEANRLDLSPFEPYFGSSLNAKIAKAELNARGQVKAVMPKSGAPSYSYRGFASLVDVRLLDRTNSAPLAGWGTLGIGGINARYDSHGLNLDIARVTFAHFFGQVLLDPQGKLNLNDVLARQREASNEPAGKQQKAPTATAQVQTPAPSAPSMPLHARIGQILLQQGHVNYTDDFVKPNYKADLEDITGTIGTFGTDIATPAPVDISASLANNGPIAIRGTANPLAPKPTLDLSASAHDIELKNLTPYSLKYAGYPITQGSLDVDLHYKLDNDQLTAENHLVIDQLTFGDHVENGTETHLPVRLAIALLKDSHGKIDVRIPVSGSLSNPQFSLGSVIWGAVRHLIERAVTAPFSLLANALGGGGNGSASAANLQYIAFAPGSAALSDSARAKLDTLVKLLGEKPGVKLDLSGRADQNVDTPGLRMAYVDDLVKQAKAKASGSGGQPVDPSTVTVSPDEYHRYLVQVYKDADFKKPRNFVGLTKTLPDEDMKRALAFHAPVNDTSVQALADQRAQNVRQYLSQKIDASRLTIVAPHFGTEGMKDNGPATRVDLAPAS
ncbi:DUF748 domain-containing protein [Trinickia dinghuensis]|uniref:DUF748 domain-containing protein n=1 Tax=Trinickia dinghuensis TaxID=2291023 RepID=A0A3D8K6D2_9BURK|nr:DUF748 domain-containing protein [Trinickia dinghuensis]RDV01004.1 DUF748 domain-containing protein [Trinickia dinghuensis]